MNIFIECDDLISVINYAKSKDYTNENNITLLGTFQGGFVSAIVAAKLKNKISKLILLCPALVIPDDARNGRIGGASYDINNVPNIINCDGFKIGKQFHDAVINVDSYELIKGYNYPVLYIQGKNDKTVNYSYAIKAKDVAYKDNCKLILLDDEGHSFSEKGKKTIIKNIKDFLSIKVNNVNKAYEAGYKEFCKNKFNVSQKLYEEWDINNVYVECNGEYSITLKANNPLLIWYNKRIT